ncbi:hypothetical protein AFV6_gp17 [Betalipothrixvirus pozzuoliense]|uniref:Uncharacterized protein n=1 Tax=Betalipothrixvirus pozzuoliense TaxID=346882 RepID=A7WKH1_9VIRU|nr:hypothetical protein AFV6_gp17 [Acidianus filamentous virus 6]CAJ31571.1 conserved hypothetical protein [Acidianus filamentous virus 6]
MESQIEVLPYPAFQLKGINQWVYKIILGKEERVIDCQKYASNSGMTSHGCYKIEINENGEISAKLTRGLWIINWKKMSFEADFKLTRENLLIEQNFIATYGDLLKKYLDTERKYLAKFDNYSINIFIARKAPTIQLQPTVTQGNLEIYSIPNIPENIKFVKGQLEYYNHYTETAIEHIGIYDGILIKIDETTEIKSKDHNPIQLKPGAYILVHPPPAID